MAEIWNSEACSKCGLSKHQWWDSAGAQCPWSLRGASSQSQRGWAAALWLWRLSGYSTWPSGSECHTGSLGTPGLKEPGSPPGTESFPHTQQEPAVMTPKGLGEPWLMETGLRFSWKEACLRSNFSQNLRKGQSTWSWHSGTVLLLVTRVTLSVQSHSQLSPPFQEKLKLLQLCENAWTSHLHYCTPLTLSPLPHQTLKITDFCLQSLDISPIFALIAFGPPALVSHICKLHGSGFSGDHLKVAGGKTHH